MCQITSNNLLYTNPTRRRKLRRLYHKFALLRWAGKQGVSISLLAAVPKLRQRQHRQPRSERSRVSAGGANGRTQWWRCWLCHGKYVVRLQLLSANPSQTNSASCILAGFVATINQHSPNLRPHFNKHRIAAITQIAPGVFAFGIGFGCQLVALIVAAQADILALLQVMQKVAELIDHAVAVGAELLILSLVKALQHTGL